jgi:uncharacterized membrane protein
MVSIRLSTIKGHWSDVLNGFWFVPGLISLCGPVLALLFVWLDHVRGNTYLPFLFTGNSSAASGILSAIAASFIAALGLSFSITIVTLQLVTSQFTPRALRGFLADRITQSVSGGFIGIFAYALLVLSAVRDPAPPSPGFVPALSVTMAICFSFLGLVLLLLFFHHTAESIQIYNITARLAKETLHAVDHLYPTWGNGPLTEDGTKLVQQWSTEATPHRIYSTRSGYVQSIAFHQLLEAFPRLGPGIRMHLAVCPGDFVTRETIIAEVWSPRGLEDGAVRLIRGCVMVLNQRDIVQDAAFGIRQLTDIALRAMSPAVNDPTTAVNCIQYLQAIFEHLAHRALPSAIHHLRDGSSLIVMRYRTFHEYLQAFVEIGRVTTDNARVADALLAALQATVKIALVKGQERVPLLLTVAEAIAHPAITDARTDLDRTQLEQRLKEIEQMTQGRREHLPTIEQSSV